MVRKSLGFQWHTGCMAQAPRILSDVVVNDHAGRILQAVPHAAFLWFTSVIRVDFGVCDTRVDLFVDTSYTCTGKKVQWLLMVSIHKHSGETRSWKKTSTKLMLLYQHNLDLKISLVWQLIPNCNFTTLCQQIQGMMLNWPSYMIVKL